MIQIKDVTKLYPAKAAGDENANGKGEQNGVRFMRSITSLWTLRRANGSPSWALRGRVNRRWSI